jgi:fibronectin-binding autotransporter adhesin
VHTRLLPASHRIRLLVTAWFAAPRWFKRLVLRVSLPLLGLSSAPGQTIVSYYWDTNGASSGFGTTATASWSTGNAQWTTNSAGTSATAGWSNTGAANKRAVFQSAASARNLNLTSDISVGDLQVLGGAYTIGASTGNRLTLLATTDSNSLLVVPEINIVSGSLTISGGLTATDGFVKTGAGSLTLSNTSNTLAGVVKISEGTLVLGNNSVLGSSSISLNGGTLSTSATRTYVKDVTVDADSSFGGSFGMTLGNATSTFQLNGSRTLTVTNSTLVTPSVSELVAGSSLTKAGSGTLFFGSAGTYTGTTTVTGGALGLGTAGALPSTNLLLNGGVLSTRDALGFSRTIGSGDNQVQFGASGGGFAAYLGPLTISFTGTETWGNGSFLPDGAPLILSAVSSTDTVTWASSLSLGATNRVINVFDGTAAVDAAITGQLTQTAAASIEKQGSGTLLLNGDNSALTGTTIISAGTLQVGSATALGSGPVALAGGSLGTDSARTITNPVSVTGATGGFAGTQPLTLSAPLTNAFAGNVTLSITNTGGTTLGDIILSNGADDRTLTFAVGVNTAITVGGAIDDGPLSTASGIAVSGSGTVYLTHANTYAGPTTLLGGTLRLGNNSALGSGELVFAGGQLTTDTARTFGNPLSVTAATATFGGSQSMTFTGAFTNRYSGAGNATLSFANTGGSVVTLNGINISDTSTARRLAFSTATNASAVVQGPIADGGASTLGVVEKAGAGTLTLNHASTYSGGTILTAGTLAIGDDNALGSGAVTFAGGLLASSGSAHTLALPVSLTTATSGFGGNQSLTLSGTLTNRYSGAGNATLTSANTAGSVITLGNVDLSDTASSRTLVFSPGAGASITVAGTIANGGSSTGGNISKSGAGILTLDHANTYSGTTTISAGTLQISTPAALAPGALLLTSLSPSAATLRAISADPMTLTNPLSLIGNAFTFAATQPLTLTGTLTNKYSAGASADIGVALGSAPVQFSNINLSDTATNRTLNVFVDNGASGTVAGVIANGDGITGTSTASGLNKTGAGTLTLSGANTYDGPTTVSSGILTLTGDQSGATGAITVNGGTLQIASALALAGAPQINLTGGSLEASAAARTVTLPVSFSGSSGMVGTQNLTFTQPLIHTGTSSTLTISNTGATIFGDLALANGSTNGDVTFSIAAATGAVVMGTVANGGTATASTLTKSGSGTLTLRGSESYGGLTTVSGGTLVFAGDHTGATGGITVQSNASVQLRGAAALSHLRAHLEQRHLLLFRLAAHPRQSPHPRRQLHPGRRPTTHLHRRPHQHTPSRYHAQLLQPRWYYSRCGGALQRLRPLELHLCSRRCDHGHHRGRHHQRRRRCAQCPDQGRGRHLGPRAHQFLWGHHDDHGRHPPTRGQQRTPGRFAHRVQSRRRPLGHARPPRFRCLRPESRFHRRQCQRRLRQSDHHRQRHAYAQRRRHLSLQ